MPHSVGDLLEKTPPLRRVSRGKSFFNARSRSNSTSSEKQIMPAPLQSFKRTFSVASDSSFHTRSTSFSDDGMDDIDVMSVDGSNGKSVVDGGETVRVTVRFRPMFHHDKNTKAAWRVDPNSNTISPIHPSTANPHRERSARGYTFDEVYRETHSTSAIYDGLARNIARSALDGIHGSIFAYGQTSSGKTYTMQGTEPQISIGKKPIISPEMDELAPETEADRRPTDSDGIIQLAIKDLFDEMVRRSDTDFLVRVSYIEIYNETVRDLLDPSNGLVAVREHPVTGVFTDASERIVSDARGVIKALRDGEKHRSVGLTLMNGNSSRSHSIFRVVIELRTKSEPISVSNQDDNDYLFSKNHQEDEGSENVVVECVRVGVLNFVDLAGSESLRLTAAKGKRLAEAGNINRSLLALSRVVAALSTRQSTSDASKQQHINFRDSKLTRILQPSLSGAARVLFICCASPAAHFIEETKSTLQFASRAKRIKIHAGVNEIVDANAKALMQLQQENQQLRKHMESMVALDEEKTRAMEDQTAHLQSQIVMLSAAVQQFMAHKIMENQSSMETISNNHQNLRLLLCKEASTSEKQQIQQLEVNGSEVEISMEQLELVNPVLEVPICDYDEEDDASAHVTSRLLPSPLALHSSVSDVSEHCINYQELADVLRTVRKREADAVARIQQLEHELIQVKQKTKSCDFSDVEEQDETVDSITIVTTDGSSDVTGLLCTKASAFQRQRFSGLEVLLLFLAMIVGGTAGYWLVVDLAAVMF